MAFDYDRSVATSRRLLTKFGQDVTVRTYTAGTYDPATGSTTPGTSDTTRKGALLAFGANRTKAAGGLIEVGDKRLLLEPGTDITTKDHIIAGGTDYIILGFDEVNPAGTVVLYDVHLRVGG